jgi:hypothetical protein
MSLSLFRELQKSIQSRRVRKQAWLGQDQPDAKGVTPFQHAAVAALQGEFAGASFSSAGSKELYLRGVLPGADATLFIYKDGAQLQARTAEFRAERWDYESPSALIKELLDHGRAALRSNTSSKRSR